MTISRRNFLLLSGLSLGSLAFRPLSGFTPENDSGDIGRVAIDSVSVYSRPSDKSTILYQRYRDEVINIYDEVISEDGPGYNPRWYRVWRGYVHSGYIQRVKALFNPVVEKLSSQTGQLADVTVPLTRAMWYRSHNQVWQPLYRLYYGSTHWVTGVDEGPDGKPWYRLKDELNEVEYHVDARHLRLIQPEAFAPISPEISPLKKRIEVSLTMQTVTAYENDQVVFKTNVSTGVPDRDIPPGQIHTETPRGEFHVYSKMPSKHMGNGQLTADLDAYELPGVPWTTFFAPNGVAFHGTYWHDNYGMTTSRGCVNMRIHEAQWIYRWTTPAAAPETWEQTGYGTLVVVS